MAAPAARSRVGRSGLAAAPDRLRDTSGLRDRLWYTSGLLASRQRGKQAVRPAAFPAVGTLTDAKGLMYVLLPASAGVCPPAVLPARLMLLQLSNTSTGAN
jgi:hypothetical protein